jgi:hypothetical protein
LYLWQVVERMLPSADDYELFVQRQAYAKFAMPCTSAIAPRLLGDIHNDVGRCNVYQIFLRRTTTERGRVLALGVEPAACHGVTEIFKLLSVWPQRESFREAGGEIISHDQICLGLNPSAASSLLHHSTKMSG